MPINASELTAQQQITAIYVAYYDRAPDPAGLQFWVNLLEAGRPLEQIATDFSSAAETIEKYPYFDAPELASADNFITSIYVNLFGRTPDAAGLEFWSNQLESGSTPVGEIILAILEGAQDEATGGFPDSETITNKIDVGLDWAISAADAGIGTNSNLIAEDVDGELVVYDQDAFESATSILDGVTGDAQSVTDALAATDEFFDSAAGAGDTFVLTTGQDDIVGTQANDDIFGLFEDTTAKTFTLGDIINGQAGIDTLTIVNDSDSNLSFAGRTITGVENLVIENATSGFDTVNLANTAFDSVTLDMGPGDTSLDANNINAASAVTITNLDIDFDSDINLDFTTSSADTGVTDITVSDTDFNELYLDVDAVFTDATEYTFNLNVSNVDSNDNFNVNTNIDLEASDIMMEVNINLSDLTGEDQNFYLDFNTNGVEMATVNIDIADSNVNELEVDIDDNSNGTGTEDVANITLTDVDIDDNLTVDHVEFINLVVNGDVFIEDMEFYDYEGDVTLDIVANGNLVIDGDLNMNDNAFNQTVLISGAGNVDLGDLDLVDDANTMQIVDASLATGDITVYDSNTALDMFTGGSGNDSLTLGTFETVASMGAGDDLVDTNGYDYGDANAGTLDGGDGIDTIAIDNGAELDADTAANISNFEVLDFSNGTGTYDLSLEASLDDIRATESIAAAVTVTEFDADNSITLSHFVDTDAITVELATDGAADATTVNIIANDTTENGTADGQTEAVLVMEEFETLTFNSTGVNSAGDVDGNDVPFVSSDYENMVDLDASDMTKLNVTGDAKTSITFTGAEALTQVNAAANTAGVTVDASTGGIVGGISFAGTDADDTFTATANGDIIQGNGGVDTITLGAGEDVVRYAAQSDSVLILTDTDDPADGVVDEGTGWDIINGFTTGDDIIELSSLLGLATGDARSAVLQKGNVDGANGTAGFQIDDLQSAVGDGVDFFSDGLVDRAVAFASSTDLGHGFILIDANADGDFNADDDMAIQLTGVTTLTVDDLQFG